MTSPFQEWRLLLSKADETTDDPDWVATNDPEAGSIDFTSVDTTFPPGPGVGWPAFTGVEIYLVGVDAARAVQDRATMTLDVQFVERFARPAALGGAVGLEDVLGDSAIVEDVNLQRKVYFPLNGGTFTIRITGDANDAVDNIEVWWRAVSR